MIFSLVGTLKTSGTTSLTYFIGVCFSGIVFIFFLTELIKKIYEHDYDLKVKQN